MPRHCYSRPSSPPSQRPRPPSHSSSTSSPTSPRPEQANAPVAVSVAIAAATAISIYIPLHHVPVIVSTTPSPPVVVQQSTGLQLTNTIVLGIFVPGNHLMSSSSNFTSSGGYLKYSSAVCRKCGLTTAIKLSETPKNPGRLFYCCVVHGWSHWCKPLNNVNLPFEHDEVTSTARMPPSNSSARGVYEVTKDALIIGNLMLVAMGLIKIIFW